MLKPPVHVAAIAGRWLRRGLLASGLFAMAPGVAFAGWQTALVPVLAEEGGEGYPILDWAIVVVLIGLAMFVICRTGRRN